MLLGSVVNLTLLLVSALPFLTPTLMSSCSHDASRHHARLYDSGETPVTVIDDTLEVEGFIAGGSFSDRQATAIDWAIHDCNSLFIMALEHFDRFRVVVNHNNGYREKCGEPANETPFGSGYLYVFRPKIKVRVDPEDIIVAIDGPEISGEEAPQYRLDDAFLSHRTVCTQKISEYRKRFGGKFVAAACGAAESKIRMTYSPDHRKEMPNLTLMSRMRLYLRKNAPEPIEELRQINPANLFGIDLFDSVRSMVQVQDNLPAVVTVNFAGSVNKIDLKSKRVLWERNLTNPSPSDVRMTTALNAVDVTKDGRLIVVGGSYGYLAVLDANSGEKVRLLSCDPKMFAPYHFVAVHIDSLNRSVYTVAKLSDTPNFSTSYKRMIFPGSHFEEPATHEVTRWDLSTGKALWRTKHSSNGVLNIGVNADDSFVFIVSTDRVTVMRPADGTLFREFPLSSYEGKLTGSVISGASFSSDMRALAISAFSGVILIDTQTTKMIRRFRAHLRAELGNPEISLENETLNGFDAIGNFYEWNWRSGQLIGMGHHDGLAINSNGPLNMPIISIMNGSYLVHSGSIYGGVGINMERIDPVPAIEKICAVGAGSELPPMTLRKAARLGVWTR